MYHYIIKSIKRQKSRSILVILVNCVLVILLNLYFGLIGSYRTQLTDLAANTPIRCTVTNPDGTMEVGIAVDSDTLRGLQAAKQIKGLDCSTQLKAGFGEFEEACWDENLNLDVSVVNKIDSTVLPEHIRAAYQEGWDEKLFAGAERVCLLKKSDMEEQGFSYEDEVPFTVYYYCYDDRRRDVDILRLGYLRLKVVGQIDFTAEAVSFYVKDPLALNAF